MKHLERLETSGAQPVEPARRRVDAASPIEIEKVEGLTWRSVAFALVLAALFGYCLPIVDFKMANTFLGSMHMPAAAIATLLALLLIVNPLLGMSAHNRVKPGVFVGAMLACAAIAGFFYQERGGITSLAFWTFGVLAVLLLLVFVLGRVVLTRNEILTVYITCLFSSLVPGRGGENFFIPNILSSFYYANRENKWLDMLTPYLKPWITPAISLDSHGVPVYKPLVPKGWYESLALGETIPWGAWLVPLVMWMALIFSLYIMQGCLGVMLRAQWAEREALAFPLLRLPLEMTEDLENQGQKSRFFRNPVMWIGFGIAVFIEGLNGLSLYYPDVPRVPLALAPAQFFTEAPWNQIGNFQMQVFPAIVGISYLLTSEVSFSLWFFHLFSKAEYIMAYLIGFYPASLEQPFWTRGWAKGFVGYQQVGAILAYVGLLVWLGREHWKHIARRAIGRAPESEYERREALSYPIAFWGFVLSFTFILGWTIAAGVKPHIAVLLWGFYVAIALALTRLVAEGGLLFVQTGWMPLGPLAFLIGAGPGKLLDVASAAPASMISSSLMLDMRGFLLPSFVQGFKLAHDRNIALRPLLALIAACVIISFSTSVWVIIHLGYQNGGTSLATWWATAGGGSQPALHTAGLIKGLDTNIAANWGWVMVGALLTLGMMTARSRFAWFPLHPIGLVMCVPFAMHAMWLSIFLGWLCKILISRFGGTESYRKGIPLFLGLALGDITMVVFWVIIDGWQGRTGHALLPF